MAESPVDNKEGRREKAKLTHPDKFLDELDGDPSIDPDVLLTEFRPELNEQFSQLDADFAGLDLDIESLDLDGEDADDIPLTFAEKWQRFKKRLKQKAKEVALKVFYIIKYWVIWIATETPKRIGALLKWIFLQIKKFVALFGSWSKKRKLLFMAAFIAIVAVGSFYGLILKSQFLHHEHYHFAGSMEEFASYTFKFDFKGPLEPFYDSPRVKAYAFQLKPIVVNLLRQGDYNRNPMGFFEFVVQGSSGEVLVELKTREAEVIDLIERVVEGHTYEKLDTPSGKDRLKEDIRRELNKILVEGIVRRIEIRNFFIKP